jgi:hypothetical protein
VGKFAAGTEVSAERTRAELERLLDRYGATQFGYVNGRDCARVGFEAHGRLVRFVLPLPARDAAEFVKTPRQGRRRSSAAVRPMRDPACPITRIRTA